LDSTTLRPSRIAIATRLIATHSIDWRSVDWFGRLRLASGLTLFTFVGTHLLNHALGLIGLEAMEIGREVFVFLWRGWVGTTLLYGAAILHLSLVLTSIYRKRGWRAVTWAEYLQIALGLCVPLLVAHHALANRGAHEMFGLEDSYALVLLALWVQKPMLGLTQCLLILIAWTHGSMGVHFWLRLKPYYPTLRRFLYPAALLLPVLSIVGFVDGGRQLEARLTDPIFRERLVAPLRELPPQAPAWVAEMTDRAQIGFTALLAVLFVARLASGAFERRRDFITLTYPGDRRVSVRRGTSVLEASRLSGIPHASVCGGRGRCSTCRVRISDGKGQLPPAGEEEMRVLARIGAPEGVRLACQLRPTADLQVTPLLPPTASARDGFRRPPDHQGSEREIAILFADLRAFTQFSEKKLPYDVVFVMNQYFRAMGEAIENAGGTVDKFIGDGVMALFGLDTDSSRGCAQALVAARDMAIALRRLNQSLANDLPAPLRIGIGIHAGTVIVGEMGHGRVMSVTAIGDAVNTASRLESMTKEFGAQLVVSKRVGKRAGVNLKVFPHMDLDVRGRTEPLAAYIVADAQDLDRVLSAAATEESALRS
jgi:adenylate cyclase